ncbi:MAG: adenylate/guanylate cyclase domain-containing protein [Thermodesulfobacteriota bacterium]
MRCRSCGFENPEGINFCGGCGVPLKNLCPKCGFENPPRFKFCGECAAPLTEQTPVPKTTRKIDKQEDKDTQVGPSLAESKAHEGERRQLTVMFCDLVGSTSISESLDPEELRDVVRTYQEACSELIDRYDGYIAQYLGDGLLVYFGYPLAHEDDAQRAVRGGLEIVGAISELSLPTLLQQSLQVRVGIHTGLVVVGEMGGGKKREPMAIVGETPNIAARLQGIAEPNTVVISSATYRLVEGLFECHNLGLHTLKGISTPMEVYQITRESGVRSRFEVTVSKGLTPLVGREQEIELLLKSWERVKEGEGQVVLLSGEAGIGKSRLVQVLKERLSGETHIRIESRCSPYYQNSALYPIIDHLQRLLFRREDSHEEKLCKLEIILEQYGFSHEETVPLFATLLSLPLSDRYPTLNLSPQRQKQKTLEALLVWLLKEAEKQPVLRVVEDLHWVDPSTLEYLSLVVEQVPRARIFALLTYRPDFSPPWAMRSHLTQITLSRLTRKQVEIMVERLTEGQSLPNEVVQQIVSKTDGISLFVEELTKMVLESGLLNVRVLGRLPPLSIPASLQDSLMARLDRLGTVKEVAQLGATLGREFTYELLQVVSPLDETSLQRELAKLVETELLYQRGLPPESRYFFKHALIQDAAYQSLLKSKRQQYHQKIAQILEERFPEIVVTEPELLAHHYTEAGILKEAIPYWQRAGERARQRSANIEAIGHLTRGLELLKILPETLERNQQEMNLQSTIAPSFMATKGYASSEVERAVLRAWELCQKLGDSPQLFPVVHALWRFYLVRPDLKTARERAEECLKIAQKAKDTELLLEAHMALGAAFLWLGDMVSAREHHQQGIDIYDPQKHGAHTFIYGQDPGVFCLSYYAWALWFSGYADKALQTAQQAFNIAQGLSHPYSLGFAMRSIAVINQLRLDTQATLKWADTLIKLSNEQGFAYWLAWGTILRGWALSKQGQGEEGVSQIVEGLTIHKDTEGELARPYFLALQAEANLEIGQAEEGISAVAEALEIVNKNEERFFEGELHRMKGELLLALSHEKQAGAEAGFFRALEVACRQSAKSLELRAVMSLSRLWQKQGKKEEAQKMLTEIYGWFTEGFETADLKKAKTLLEELS